MLSSARDMAAVPVNAVQNKSTPSQQGIANRTYWAINFNRKSHRRVWRMRWGHLGSLWKGKGNTGCIRSGFVVYTCGTIKNKQNIFLWRKKCKLSLLIYSQNNFILSRTFFLVVHQNSKAGHIKRAQWLRPLATSEEDLGLTPSTTQLHTMVCNSSFL